MLQVPLRKASESLGHELSRRSWKIRHAAFHNLRAHPFRKRQNKLINLNLPICRVSGKVMIFPWFSHDFPGIPSPWAPATQHEPPLPAKLPVAFALAAALAQLFQQPLHKSKLEQLETWTCQAGRAWDFSGSLGKMYHLNIIYKYSMYILYKFI